MNLRIVRILAMSLLFALDACNGINERHAFRSTEVEVSPGRFIAIQTRVYSMDDNDGSFSGLWHTFRDALSGDYETSELRIPWNGSEVRWKGTDIPIVMREYSNILYVVGFDRNSKRRQGERLPFFRYYRQDDSTFSEIDATEFPKSVATQNMWVHDGDFPYVLEYNPTRYWFRHSLTARLWLHLSIGKQYYETENLPEEQAQRELERYMADYKPSRLTIIMKRAPVTNMATQSGAADAVSTFPAKESPCLVCHGHRKVSEIP